MTMGLGPESLGCMENARDLPSGDHAYPPTSPLKLDSGFASPPRRSSSMIWSLFEPAPLDVNAR